MSDLNRSDERLKWLRGMLKETTRARKQALIDQRYWRQKIDERKEELGI